MLEMILPPGACGDKPRPPPVAEETQASTMLIFRLLVAAHILTGTTGALSLWVPLLGRKGGPDHKSWGRIFVPAMLLTGFWAICMSLLTLAWPLQTHPQLVGKFDAGFIRGIFGWMMLHMGILTINLTWYGWLCVRNRQNHAANLEWRNLALQAAILIAAINLAVQGALIHQPLMIGASLVGLATGATNLYFLYKPKRRPQDWQKEHLKALVGAGISVYTAFMAFGSVRIFPALALHPAMWSVPLTLGVGTIIYHWRVLDRRFARIGARKEDLF